MMSIYDRFLTTAREYPDKIFLIEVSDEPLRESSYSSILEQVDALAERWLERGIERGDRIVILSESRTEWVVAFLAANRLGCIVVPLDPERSEQEWIDSIFHCTPSVLIISSRFERNRETLQKAATDFRFGLYFDSVSRVSKNWESFEEWTRPVNSAGARAVTDARIHEVALIYHTSGTGGESKAVQLTNRALLSNSEYMYRFSGATRGQGGRMLSIAPLHHVLGMNALISVFYSCSGISLFPSISRELIRKAFTELRPHYVIGVPSFYEKLASNIEKQLRREAPALLQKWLDRYIESGARRAPRWQCFRKRIFRKVHQNLGGRITGMASGGAALDSSTIRFFYSLGLPLYEGYGLTESTGAFTFNRPGCYKIGTVGKPFAEGTDVRIDHPDEQDVGELCLKGPLVMKGYYHNDEANQEAVDSNGWFHTGDLASIDSEGFVSIVGRQKDVIVSSNGKNVYPEEIEKYFAQVPLIQELCVYGIPELNNQTVNESVCLHIVPDLDAIKSEGSDSIENKIRESVTRLGEKLAPFRRPRKIIFSHKALPRTSSLKVKKFQLRKETMQRG